MVKPVTMLSTLVAIIAVMMRFLRPQRIASPFHFVWRMRLAWVIHDIFYKFVYFRAKKLHFWRSLVQ